MRHLTRPWWLFSALLLFVSAPLARAEVVRLEILERQPFADGAAFGDTGPFERILGVAHFAIDPEHPRNKAIVDLGRAPRNKDGKVEFQSDVFILAPKDLSKGNGALLYDVNNRGHKLALRFFNDALGTNHPVSASDAGNGFLMRKGYTVVWCGWIGELLSGDSRMLLKPPVATQEGQPIRGLVRYEMVTDAPAETLPLSRREGHGSYSPTERGEKEGVLTWRLRETDERIPIPREQWSLERQPIAPVKQGVPGTLGQIRCRVAGGFRPGYIYELVCEAEGPIVQGTGYAATRDLISFLRYDSSDRNPLRSGDGKPAIERAHAFGVSQSGRFLRNYLYLGFNADEAHRKVFDGLMPHVAGGGLGFFNHRFAQPTRHNGQHEEHAYPADVFPFTYGESYDPILKRRDGILSRMSSQDKNLLPKVMHTQSAAEYWHRSGSLVHTDPRGLVDEAIPDNVRIYAFGGTQHGPHVGPLTRGIADNYTNPGDYRPQLRALLEALDAWTRDGTAPPASVYPRLDNGTLVDWRQEHTGFPYLPGIRYPEVIQQPQARDYGPDFWLKGIITIEPPRVLGQYRVLVPKCDADGNDLGTLLPLEVAVPVATYTGWNLRRREVGAEGQLASLFGSYIPFPRTKAERIATGDPRLSLEERYGTFAAYRDNFAAQGAEMVKQRHLLQEDLNRMLANLTKVEMLFTNKK
ncbi:MAG: alpha/beta hydrolase domain-containing protein [Gemmataceae bacterium]